MRTLLLSEHFLPEKGGSVTWLANLYSRFPAGGVVVAAGASSGAEEPVDFREAVLRDERFMSLYLSDRGPSASLVGAQLKHVEWPEGTLVALVRRGGAILIPSGGTTLRAGDRLSIVGETNGIQAVRARYGSVADLEIPDFISGELDPPRQVDPPA